MTGRAVALTLAVALIMASLVQPVAAQPRPLQPPTMTLELPYLPQFVDAESGLFRFQLQYIVVTVIGGLVGHTLMEGLGHGFPFDVWGAIGGAAGAGLYYILRRATFQDGVTGYR